MKSCVNLSLVHVRTEVVFHFIAYFTGQFWPIFIKNLLNSGAISFLSVNFVPFILK